MHQSHIAPDFFDSWAAFGCTHGSTSCFRWLRYTSTFNQAVVQLLVRNKVPIGLGFDAVERRTKMTSIVCKGSGMDVPGPGMKKVNYTWEARTGKASPESLAEPY